MKLKVYRQSGSPVHPENQQKYVIEYREFYDRCEKKADKIFAKEVGKLTKTPRMFVLQRLLSYGERFLMRKYGGQDEVELPKTSKAWATLITKYADTPLMIAKEKDSGKLVLLLMDDL